MSARKKVLVVDDDADSASMLEMFVGLLGHEARCATSGAMAVAAAVESRPDVVLLDLSLPDLDGFEVHRRLRAAGLTPVVVALTGWSDPGVRAKARAEGMAHFMVKPVDPDRLERLLATG